MATAEVYQSASSGPFVILERRKKGKEALVRFLNTGFVRAADVNACLRGNVRDPYARAILGLGYLGEGYKDVPYYRRAHQLWQDVLKRCYSLTRFENREGYYHKGVQVAVRWLNFSLFLEDLPGLEGFDRWLAGERMHLDKDKRGSGLYYSRETCVFLTEHESVSTPKPGRVSWKRGKVFDKVNRVWVPDPRLNVDKE
jgi:hypothetical protein